MLAHFINIWVIIEPVFYLQSRLTVFLCDFSFFVVSHWLNPIFLSTEEKHSSSGMQYD